MHSLPNTAWSVPPEAAEELSERKIAFTEPAQKEMQAMCNAVLEILNMATETFIKNDVELAHKVEPLEQVIDLLKKRMRDSHIARLKEGGCSIEAGFVWADLITDMERIHLGGLESLWKMKQ